MLEEEKSQAGGGGGERTEEKLNRLRSLDLDLL